MVVSNKNPKSRVVKNERYRTVSAKSSWFVNFHSKAISKWWTDPMRTRHTTYPLSRRRFRIRSQIIFSGVGQRHFPVCSEKTLQRTVDSTSPRWNISRHLPTTMSGLAKNSKNFQPLVSSKTSYSLEYLWRRNITDGSQQVCYQYTVCYQYI